MLSISRAMPRQGLWVGLVGLLASYYSLLRDHCEVLTVIDGASLQVGVVVESSRSSCVKMSSCNIALGLLLGLKCRASTSASASG